MIDWVRDREGKPRSNQYGYVLSKPSGACFAVTVEDVPRLRELLNEIAGGEDAEAGR